MNLLKMCGPQIRFFLCTFRPIASKKLNNLTTIDTLSWLAGAVVTHPLWMQDVPGSIAGSGKGFGVWFFCFYCCCYCVFYFLSESIFVTTFCNSLCNVNSLSLLNTLPNMWPVIRVSRYRPSIINKITNKRHDVKTCFKKVKYG